MVRTADSGNTFAIWESSTAGTYYGATDLSAADCPAAAPAGYSPGRLVSRTRIIYRVRRRRAVGPPPAAFGGR